MKLCIDIRDTNTKVIDDANYRFADSKSVINIINNNSKDNKYNSLINLIGDSIGLTKADKYLYYIICYYSKDKHIDIDFILRGDVTIRYSNSAMRKSLVHLLDSGIVSYCNNYKSVRLVDKYNINKVLDINNNNSDKTFIVIEL